MFLILSVILQGQDLPLEQAIVAGPLQRLLCHAPSTWTAWLVSAVTIVLAEEDRRVGGAGNAQLSILHVGQTQLILFWRILFYMKLNFWFSYIKIFCYFNNLKEMKVSKHLLTSLSENKDFFRVPSEKSGGSISEWFEPADIIPGSSDNTQWPPARCSSDGNWLSILMIPTSV